MSRHREVLALGSKAPTIGEVSFVAPNANVIGDVHIGKDSGVWFGAVLKGDLSKIRIGQNSMIKDRAVLSSSLPGSSISIGDNVVIGHGAVVGAATIEDDATIGLGATIADGAVIKKGAYVAPGSVVESKTTVPGGQVNYGHHQNTRYLYRIHYFASIRFRLDGIRNADPALPWPHRRGSVPPRDSLFQSNNFAFNQNLL